MQVVVGGASYANAVAHGHPINAGSGATGTARADVLRAGTHAREGFREFHIQPAGTDRVTTRRNATERTPPRVSDRA